MCLAWTVTHDTSDVQLLYKHKSYQKLTFLVIITKMNNLFP